MSVRVMTAVWDRYPGGGGELNLALALADHSHDDGTHIYPGVPHLATKTRQSERQVQRQLKAMQASGWLILVRPGVGGRPSASGSSSKFAEYRISPRWLKGEELPISARAEKGDKTAPISATAADTEKGGKTSPISAVDKSPTNDAGKGDISDGAYKNQEEPPLNPPTPQGGADAFDALCKAYPRHRVNWSAARRRWDELSPDAQLQAILVREAGVQARRPEWQDRNGQAVPKLSGWILNKGWLWTHEPDAPAAPTPVSKEAAPAAPQLSEEERQAARQRALEARERARALVEGARRKGVPA